MTGFLTEQYLRLPDGSFPHLGIRGGGDVAEVVLLSGSPDRVELMAGMMQNTDRVGSRRGYAVYTGEYGGTRLSVATSGVGSPSLAIAVEELGACGSRTFLRVGSCAAIADRVAIGDIVIVHAAVCDEGTSRYYAPTNFPPVGSPRVVQALLSAANRLRTATEIGMSRSTDSFYEGERKLEIIELWRKLGVLTFEMETSALFTIAAVRGWEAGSIVVAGSNLVSGEATYAGHRLEEYAAGQERMLEVALSAAVDLAPR
jgi:uridine phosphorylase